VAAVRDNGKPIEYFVATDEDDGFAKPIGHRYLSPGRASQEVFVHRKKVFHRSV
jgi:hypothetical protein